jgi:hypothetical protein
MNARFVGTTADQVLNEFGAIPLGIGMNRADARKALEEHTPTNPGTNVGA